MSEVLKWFEDNIYYSVNSGTATFSIQNEDLWEFEELLKKQDRELQQKENIIKEVRKEMENAKHISIDDSKAIIKHEKRILEILDKVKK